jgi:hypothetical protein
MNSELALLSGCMDSPQPAPQGLRRPGPTSSHFAPVRHSRQGRRLSVGRLVRQRAGVSGFAPAAAGAKLFRRCLFSRPASAPDRPAYRRGEHAGRRHFGRRGSSRVGRAVAPAESRSRLGPIMAPMAAPSAPSSPHTAHPRTDIDADLTDRRLPGHLGRENGPGHAFEQRRLCCTDTPR